MFHNLMSDTYNITLNIFKRRKRRVRRLVLKFGKPIEKTASFTESSSSTETSTSVTEKRTMATASAVMTVTQKVSATITPEDANGNVVPIPDGDAVVWTSSDPTIVTVTPSVDGLSCVCASAGKVGSVTINVVINNATGAAMASATGTIQVTPAGISQVAMSFGTPA